jgi:hypothetical protein
MASSLTTSHACVLTHIKQQAIETGIETGKEECKRAKDEVD